MAYAHVTGGVIDHGPGPLPQSWRNVSGLDRASPQELTFLGWLPVIPDEVPEGHSVTGRSYSVVGDEVHETLTTEPSPAPSPLDVQNERARRQAVGFSFDFGDERGVHEFATTTEDMVGWDQVTTIAQTLLNLSQGTQEITIRTSTGACQVTALEWQMVLLAAAAFFQPIWQASFALQEQDPIPADYADDSNWP